MKYSNESKTALIAILWGLIALIAGMYFWLTRRTVSVAAAAVVNLPVASTRKRKILITLNEILISSEPSMEIFSENVLSLSSFIANAGIVILMYTVPAELRGESHNPPKCVVEVINRLVEKGALVEQGFKPHRIIYTTTREGRICVAREIQADMTIESDESIACELEGKIPKVSRLTASNFRDFIRSF